MFKYLQHGKLSTVEAGGKSWNLYYREITMDIVRLIYNFLVLLSMLCAIFLLKYSYSRRNIPGAKYFILVIITMIIYDCLYIGELNATNFQNALIWFHLEHLVIPLIHYYWFMMSIDYVRLPKNESRILKYIMLCHPILAYILYFTNGFHHLYISKFHFISNGYFKVISTTKGILYIAPVIWGSALGLISIFLYVRSCIKAHRLYRKGYIIMITASIIPWVTIFINVCGLNPLGVDNFPVATSVSGLLYLYGIFQYHIFNTIPIATETVFRQAREGIILLDYMDRIIEANEVAVGMYPELKYLKKENTLSSFVQRHPEFGGLLDNKDGVNLHYLEEHKDRYYIAKVNGIASEDDLQIGKIITISDMTQIIQHQKKLELIATDAIDKAETNEISFLQAQINPHFLNNTLSVIASMITRAPEEAKVLITDLGEYLSRCYYFDSASSMISLKKELETIFIYVNIEKARFRERVNFHIVCDSIPEINVPRLVLQPLVENAIRHGILKKAQGGNVWLRIERMDEGILFEVKDDGVGMSDEMMASLTIANPDRKGIGIINIHNRLQKYYREGLTIKKAESGTSVSFYIPEDELK